jgi:hypothetical protein
MAQDSPIAVSSRYRRAAEIAGTARITRMSSKKNNGCTKRPKTMLITTPGNSAIRRIIAITLSNPILPSKDANTGTIAREDLAEAIGIVRRSNPR